MYQCIYFREVSDQFRCYHSFQTVGIGSASTYDVHFYLLISEVTCEIYFVSLCTSKGETNTSHNGTRVHTHPHVRNYFRSDFPCQTDVRALTRAVTSGTCGDTWHGRGERFRGDCSPAGLATCRRIFACYRGMNFGREKVGSEKKHPFNVANWQVGPSQPLSSALFIGVATTDAPSCIHKPMSQKKNGNTESQISSKGRPPTNAGVSWHPD